MFILYPKVLIKYLRLVYKQLVHKIPVHNGPKSKYMCNNMVKSGHQRSVEKSRLNPYDQCNVIKYCYSIDTCRVFNRNFVQVK